MPWIYKMGSKARHKMWSLGWWRQAFPAAAMCCSICGSRIWEEEVSFKWTTLWWGWAVHDWFNLRLVKLLCPMGLMVTVISEVIASQHWRVQCLRRAKRNTFTNYSYSGKPEELCFQDKAAHIAEVATNITNSSKKSFLSTLVCSSWERLQWHPCNSPEEQKLENMRICFLHHNLVLLNWD